MIRRYILYLARWQASTLILAPCLVWLAAIGPVGATVVANLIGGLLFFWVDAWIFLRSGRPMWEVEWGCTCGRCNTPNVLGLRLVFAPGYDRRSAAPVYLCPSCSAKKTAELRSNGVKV